MKHNFKKLDIWKRSLLITKEVYEMTKNFPDEEKFGLIAQMRRAAVSIPSNIAEDCGRNSDKQLAHFLDIAIGSTCELETQFYLCFDLELITEKESSYFTSAITELRKMIIGFNNSLQ